MHMSVMIEKPTTRNPQCTATMTSGTVDGLHYELHGGPIAGREVVLMSSGLGGSGSFWGPQMAALTERPTHSAASPGNSAQLERIAGAGNRYLPA